MGDGGRLDAPKKGEPMSTPQTTSLSGRVLGSARRGEDGKSRPAEKRAHKSSNRTVLRPLVGVALVLLICELVSRFEILSSKYFPPVTAIVTALLAEAGATVFWKGLWYTLEGWGTGLLCGTALATVFGLIFGASPFLLRSFRLIIEALRPASNVNSRSGADRTGGGLNWSDVPTP